MKLSKLWSMLILIASALLLSAANNAIQPSPKAENIPKAPSAQIGQKTQDSQNIQHPAPTRSVCAQTPNLNDGQRHGDNSAEKEATYTGLLFIVGIVGIVIACAQVWAAYASADAAIIANAAYLNLLRFWLEGKEGRGHDIMDGGVGVIDPVLHYSFQNYGKSPAFLLEMCWESVIAPRLPPTPVYRNSGELGEGIFVIPAENEIEHQFKWSHLFGTYLAEDVVAPVRRTEKRFYVYGFFRFRDVFNRRWSAGFAYQFDMKGQAHVVAPDIAPAYWFRRLEKQRWWQLRTPSHYPPRRKQADQ